MRGKPDLNQFLSGGAAAAAEEFEPRSAAQIVALSLDQLRPNDQQDRDDLEGEDAREHIRSLAESMKLKLPNGELYGVRRPIEVRSADADGLHEIIAGENRWRAAKLAGLETVPCIIKDGDAFENRLDHVTDNALRRNLSLWEQANSIRRDQDEYGLNTQQVIIAHGLRNKSQLSKLMAVFKLSEEAQAFVRKGYVQDPNLVYELRKLPEEQLAKLGKRVIDKGEAFPTALKALLPKEGRIKTVAGEGAQQRAERVILTLSPQAARALASLLNLPTDDDLASLAKQLQASINAWAEVEA
ncbi:MAG TPA: ParB/RepB/Spo0J family partition protein [Pseudomonas xinjiangensis]|uniref:ParB/RepB/Spo0J family partition protein n=2 Tax=root TaxID=1 RepID=A0A7V1BT93_9GAMM|nr:ParB/RepB/Spo0J family partition protein [Halopseudomonas xinjiangensis]HEC46553.1 ParB/RepB/Spo0J family partition protein [Halopseudomonas xinjiangensis]